MSPRNTFRHLLLVVLLGLLRSYERYEGFVGAKAGREPTAPFTENRLGRTFAGVGRMSRKWYKGNGTFGRFT